MLLASMMRMIITMGRTIPLAPDADRVRLFSHLLFAAIGLLGKVLGPLGLSMLVWRGHWPLATAVLGLTNALIWWVPFSLYLYDAWPAFRRSVWSPQQLEEHQHNTGLAWRSGCCIFLPTIRVMMRRTR
jgi:hypothetical protein